MPATRDFLLLKIKQLENQIAQFIVEGNDTTILQRQLKETKDAFIATGNALNENTSLLKG